MANISSSCQKEGPSFKGILRKFSISLAGQQFDKEPGPLLQVATLREGPLSSCLNGRVAPTKRPPCGPRAGELRNKPRAGRIRPAVLRADGLPVASVCCTDKPAADGWRGTSNRGFFGFFFFFSDQLPTSCVWGAPRSPSGAGEKVQRWTLRSNRDENGDRRGSV